MANTRQKLAPYRGFTVVKVNGYRYFGHGWGATFEKHSLVDLKKQIDAYVRSKRA